MSTKTAFIQYIHTLQDRICKALEEADGRAVFAEDRWSREEGGGGITRIIADGAVFEKGGVNTSVVKGVLPPAMQEAFKVGESNFFACGLSLVLHPINPYVPTVHANWRYFELYDKNGGRLDSWFGGGADLTPYYLFKEDAKHFHCTLKNAMDPFGTDLYPRYKEQCDRYFVNPHRDGEARGIGGVFYDYIRPASIEDEEKWLRFQQANGDAFLDAYLPIAAARRDMPYGEREKEWQEIRRGRYVEFNLIHDRGTLFGLKTKGRTESILMSLPPRARWQYNQTPAPGSPEALLVAHLQPQDWINI